MIDALNGCELVYGTSARSRSLEGSLCDARQCAEQIHQEPKRKVAIVFGRERSGLTNEELAYCHYHINIPTDKDFSSLNLAAAIQVIVYELKMAALEPVTHKIGNQIESVTAEQMAGFFEHLQNTMTGVEFLDPNHPKLLMQRLRRLFNRTQLEKEELNILRGFLTAVDKKL